MQNTNDPIQEIVARYPPLAYMLAWMEANEDWPIPTNEAMPVISPILEMVQNEHPPVFTIEDARLASEVMSALHVSPNLVLLDWIDRNAENDVGRLFLSSESTATDSFKQTTRHRLLVFLRTELLHLFFNKEHLSWVRKHL